MVEPSTVQNDGLIDQLHKKPFYADAAVSCDAKFNGACLSTQLENENVYNKTADKLVRQLFAVMKKA